MKKALILLTALFGVAFADTTKSITLSSYYTIDGVNYDALANFYGKTKEQVTALGTSITEQNAIHISSNKAVTLKTADMLLSGADVADNTAITITSLTFLARTDDNHQANKSTASITIGDQTYTSAEAQYINGSADGQYAKVTYTFAEGSAPVITLGSDATFTLTASSADLNRLGIGVFKTLPGATIVYGSDWYGVFQIAGTVSVADTVSIPEPATATLSLLALAGLCARRRRK